MSWPKKKPSRPEPSTTFPVEFFQATGIIMLRGRYYGFTVEKSFEDSITTTTRIARADDGTPVDASSKEYKDVITAIKETFKGTV
jgi:hypothetical protein